MADITRRPLGDLERAVMDVLWEHSSPPSPRGRVEGGPIPGRSMTVHAMCDALAARSLAYNTVMTTLDRLHKKGLLEREKDGHAFVYRPRVTREAYERHLVAAILEDLPTASRDALLSGFLDFAALDDEALDALERLIAERKRERP